MFCNCKPIVTLSPYGRKISKTLENLTYIYLFVSLLKLMCGDFNSFLNDLFTILILVMSFLQANFFVTAILIFFLIFNSFYILVFLLLLIQDWFIGFEIPFNAISSFYVFLVIVSFLLNIYLIMYSFFAYKEYKALYMEQFNRNNYRMIYIYYFRITA